MTTEWWWWRVVLVLGLLHAGVVAPPGLAGAGQAPPSERQASEPAPLSLLILIDVSGSMLAAPPSSPWSRQDQRLRTNDLRRVVDRIASLLEAGDCGILGTFGANIRVDGPCGPAASLSKAASGLARIPDPERHGPSAVWDAVDASIERLQAEGGRRAILLITDGLATGNRRGLDEVTARARREAVVVNVLGVPARSELPQTEGMSVVLDPAVLLRRLALATGGQHVEYEDRNRAPLLVDKLIASLRQPEPARLVSRGTGVITTRHAHVDASRLRRSGGVLHCHAATRDDGLRFALGNRRREESKFSLFFLRKLNLRFLDSSIPPRSVSRQPVQCRR
jgi:hypothetical protein